MNGYLWARVIGASKKKIEYKGWWNGDFFSHNEPDSIETPKLSLDDAVAIVKSFIARGYTFLEFSFDTCE